jgi:membrane protein
VSSSLLKSEDNQAVQEMVDQIVEQVAPQLNLIPPGSDEEQEVSREEVENMVMDLVANSSLLKSDDDQAVREMVDQIVEKVATQLGLNPSGTDQDETDPRERVSEQIMDFIGNIHSGALGLTGTLALIAIAVGLLANIEATFNDIWGVARGRSWVSRFVQYWAAITLGPMLMVLAMGLTIGGKVEAAQQSVEKWLPIIGGPLVTVATYFAPFVILTATFMLLYMLMPNTRVDWRAALIGGLVGSLLWNLNSNFNVLFATKVVNTSKIYGPLGIVPVFLIGMYFSWMIMLFGAQVSYAFQNRRSYLQERQAESVNERGREFVALRLMTRIARDYQNAQPPPAPAQLADQLDVPLRLVHRIAQLLVEARLLMEVQNGSETGYAPARPLDQITCHDILLALRTGRGQQLSTRQEPARNLVLGEFERIEEAERRAAAAVNLLALVHRSNQEEPVLENASDTKSLPPARA